MLGSSSTTRRWASGVPFMSMPLRGWCDRCQPRLRSSLLPGPYLGGSWEWTSWGGGGRSPGSAVEPVPVGTERPGSSQQARSIAPSPVVRVATMAFTRRAGDRPSGPPLARTDAPPLRPGAGNTRPVDGHGARRRRLHPALVAVTAVAFGLRAWDLSLNGLGNAFYSAAARSGAVSWHSWFFASFDPGGFISVDKPPVAVWIQGLSVRIFGMSSWSLLLPSVIAGTATVALLWCIVR